MGRLQQRLPLRPPHVATAMSTPQSPVEPALEIDLRDPSLAALLAWLWPGAGHVYQRRYGKGILFMVCILGTLTSSAWPSARARSCMPRGTRSIGGGNIRCSLAWGCPAIPAIVQSMVVRRGNPPILGGIMAPPRDQEKLSEWHKTLNIRFELGTLYTMIAGLLNILAIWDAYGGPVVSEPGKPERGPPDDDKTKDKDKDKKGN